MTYISTLTVTLSTLTNMDLGMDFDGSWKEMGDMDWMDWTQIWKEMGDVDWMDWEVTGWIGFVYTPRSWHFIHDSMHHIMPHPS